MAPPPPEGLVYFPDTQPGVTRRRRGRGFSYVGPDGTSITRGEERARLEAMAVPPAYENVWMCPIENGHLMATGYDSRERKQYRYHPDWTSSRSETKFASLPRFGRALPAIRLQVRKDLAHEAGEPSFALAAAVTLIDRLSLRVGHEDYAEANGSYGALTLRRRHVRLADGRISLRFTAKGGKKVRRQLSDRTLLQVLEKASHLPGAELLTWVDPDHRVHSVSSGALNRYLVEAGGSDDFTAKTFRTWAGTLAAFEAAEAQGDRVTIKAMATAASERLHNTPTVARNSYIHPKVIALTEMPLVGTDPVRLPRLGAAETRLLSYLEG